MFNHYSVLLHTIPYIFKPLFNYSTIVKLDSTHLTESTAQFKIWTSSEHSPSMSTISMVGFKFKEFDPKRSSKKCLEDCVQQSKIELVFFCLQH